MANFLDQMNRYGEMVDVVNKMARDYKELTEEERNLFSVGYKNLMGDKRQSYRTLRSIREKVIRIHS